MPFAIPDSPYVREGPDFRRSRAKAARNASRSLASHCYDVGDSDMLNTYNA